MYPVCDCRSGALGIKLNSVWKKHRKLRIKRQPLFSSLNYNPKINSEHKYNNGMSTAM